MFMPSRIFSWGRRLCNTVDGQNPAPPQMMIIPLFIGFLTIPGGAGFRPSTVLPQKKQETIGLMALKIWIWDILGPLGPQEIVVQRSHPPQNQTFKNHCLQYQVGKSGQNRNLFVILPPHPTQQQKKRTTHGYHWIHSPSLTWNLNMMFPKWISYSRVPFSGSMLNFVYQFTWSQANEPTMSFLCPVDQLTIHPGELVLLGRHKSITKRLVKDSDITKETNGQVTCMCKWIYLLLCTF